MSTLGDVSIIVPTFLRPGYLQDCIEALGRHLPECEVIVIDDGNVHPATMAESVIYKIIPFDSGLPAKRNLAVRLASRKFCLVFCDDFQASPGCRSGVESLIKTLDKFPHISVASGRVNHLRYEGNIEYVPGQFIRERRLIYHDPMKDGDCQECELTVNYFLARTEVLREIPWDDRMVIGGEHISEFLELKMANKKVVWVKGVNVNTFPPDLSKQHSDYARYRRRAWSLGHRIMKEKYNIRRYIDFDGAES